jgi:hypothetical protein
MCMSLDHVQFIKVDTDSLSLVCACMPYVQTASHLATLQWNDN